MDRTTVLKRIICAWLTISLLFCLCSCERVFPSVLSGDGDEKDEGEDEGDEKEKEEEKDSEKERDLPASDTVGVGELLENYRALTPVSSGKASAGTLVTFGENEITLDGEGAEANGTSVTITKSGSYTLRGSCDDGEIIVNVSEKEKVTLVLDGISLENPCGAAIYVVSAPKKAVVEAAADSVNIVIGAKTFPSDADAYGNTPNAAVYSKDDLSFCGSGEVYIASPGGKGVNCRDDLEIDGAALFVASADNGIVGKDSVNVTAGDIRICALGDGLKASGSDDDASLGTLTIVDGDFEIVSALDSIQANSTLTIGGGSFDLICGGGAAANTDSHSDSFGPGGRGGPGGRDPFGRGGKGNDTTADDADTASMKAIKSDGNMVISGGDFKIDSNDDALHTNADMKISGGIFAISSGSKGLHADGKLDIEDGKITVSKSYEGVEGRYITVCGGELDITASDDGFNACDKSSSGATAGFGGGFGGGRGGPGGSSDCSLSFTGGYTLVNASGDGIDSNGNIYMSGGTLVVFGPTDDGNGPIDFGDSNNYFRITGGNLLAVGSSGMAETADGDGVGVLAFRCGNVSSGSTMYICDSYGRAVLGFTTPKKISSCVFSSPALNAGESYLVYSGGSFEGNVRDGVSFSPTCASGGSLLGTIDAG